MTVPATHEPRQLPSLPASDLRHQPLLTQPSKISSDADYLRAHITVLTSSSTPQRLAAELATRSILSAFEAALRNNRYFTRVASVLRLHS